VPLLRRAPLHILILILAAACAAPPTPAPDTATPNGVQTAQALLTLSFAPLTPTASEVPSETPPPTDTPLPATASASATLAASDTATAPPSTATETAATLTPTPPLTATRRAAGTVTATPRVSATATLSVTATASLSATATLTPTAAPRILPSNAISLTQATVLAQAVISGTQPPRLDEAAWAPDGQLAAAGAPGVLFAQGDLLTATAGYTMGVWVPSLSFSPDNRALALSSVGGTVRLFNRANGALLFQLVQPNLSVPQVRYRPGPPGVLAQYMATLAGDNLVYMWDVAYRKYLGLLNPGPGNAGALEFSGDGQWLAAASGNDVVIWDMTTLPPTGWSGPLTPTLRLNQAAAVTGLALSADGLFLAAANADGTIAIWTVPAGQRLAVFPRFVAVPERLAFSPDGQLLAAAYTDQIIRLWTLAAPQAPLAALAGHTNRITGLAFSPDGSALASSSWDGTVREWRVGTATQAQPR